MKKIFITILASVSLYSAAFAQIPDLPVFYRAPLSYHFPTRKVDDKVTHIDFRYSEGSTNNSRNSSDKKTHLFNEHGSTSLKNIALNVEGVTSGGAKNTTYQKFYAGDEIAELYDGTVAFTGDFKTKQYDFTLNQNLKWGFYLQAHIPIRNVKIKNIGYVHTVTTESEQTIIDSFIANDLDTVLADNDLKPFQTVFSREEVSDSLISLGWHGYDTKSWGVIDSLRGLIQIGAVCPLSSRRPKDHVFAIGTGYENHWGVNMQMQAHITLWKKLMFGIAANSTILLKETYECRMVTSADQNGWIVLEKGYAEVDPGSVWRIGGYVGTDRLFGGFSAMAGYSYAKRESSYLSVRDTNFLQTAALADSYLSKDTIVNTDKRLKGWYHHTLHFMAEYNVEAHTDGVFAPRISVFYDMPLTGQYIWTTEMIGGTLGAQISWRF